MICYKLFVIFHTLNPVEAEMKIVLFSASNIYLKGLLYRLN